MEFAEIRRLTIVALFSDDTLFEQLVLKGGNAISLIYELGGRASLDVDVSMEKDFSDVEEAKQRISEALGRKFGEHGVVVFDNKFGPRPHVMKEDAPWWWGGYQFEFKLIEKAKYMGLGDDANALRRNAIVVGANQERRF